MQNNELNIRKDQKKNIITFKTIKTIKFNYLVFPLAPVEYFDNFKI